MNGLLENWRLIPKGRIISMVAIPDFALPFTGCESVINLESKITVSVAVAEVFVRGSIAFFERTGKI